MINNGETVVTVAGLAGRAGVSRSWTYTQPDLRDQIDQAQQHARPTCSHAPEPNSRASAESLKRRLELAHQTMRQLRAENQQLRQDLARVCGQLREAKVSPRCTTPFGDRE